jgi:hypothetical protein
MTASEALGRMGRAAWWRGDGGAIIIETQRRLAGGAGVDCAPLDDGTILSMERVRVR